MKSASELGEFVENFSPCNLHLEDPSAAPQDDKVRGVEVMTQDDEFERKI